MKTDIHHKIIVIFLLVLSCFAVFSFSVFAAEKEGEEAQKVEDERMTKEGQTALVAASNALQANDFATAEKTLVDYLATNPTYKPEILYQMLGSTYFNQEKFKEGAKMFKEAFELFPENYDYLTNQTVCTLYYAQNNNDKNAYLEAAKLFEKSYTTIPGKDSEMLKNAALCYYQGDNLTEAKRVFIELYNMKSEPDFEILDTIYSICEELGQKDEMQKYLYVMMDLKPLKYEYWLLLAQMYAEKDDYQNFTAALEIAYSIQLKDKSDLDKLVSLYNYLNVPLRISKTLVDNSDKFELDKNDKLKVINGYYSTNRFDKTVSYIDEANKNKKDVDLMVQKANILLETRKNEEAIKAADEIIAADPSKGTAYMIKGYASWDMEHWDAAKAAFEKASNFSDQKSTAKYLVEVIESLESAKEDLEYAIAEAAARKEADDTAFTPSE